MVCPVCGSDEAIILKNKLIKGKNKEIREFLLKCDECGSVYNERISQDNPKPFRLIISEHEDTHKIFIDLFPDEQLAVGDFLMSELGKVKITSLELEGEKRVKKAIARDVKTIWASSEEIPARFGVSIDLHGKVASFKCETERDFKIAVDDIEIDLESNIVYKNSVPVELTALEYRLLLIFANNKGVLLSRSQILDKIWDIDGNFVEDNTLTVDIKRLREKLGKSINIETVRGIGYRVD